jgi:hypothetical protein
MGRRDPIARNPTGDVRDANELAIDDEGMELPTLEAVPQDRKIIGEYG